MREKITGALAEKIASLSMITLSPEEKASFTFHLNRILGYMEKLNRLDTSGIEPTSHVASAENVLRSDEPRESLAPEEALAGAPGKHSGYFRVPRILRQQ